MNSLTFLQISNKLLQLTCYDFCRPGIILLVLQNFAPFSNWYHQPKVLLFKIKDVIEVSWKYDVQRGFYLSCQMIEDESLKMEKFSSFTQAWKEWRLGKTTPFLYCGIPHVIGTIALVISRFKFHAP